MGPQCVGLYLGGAKPVSVTLRVTDNLGATVQRAAAVTVSAGTPNIVLTATGKVEAQLST